jgi:hypothetical protein
MKRVPVQSSNVRSVGHAGRMLEVEFKTGAVYQFENVHPNTIRGLLKAPSKGKYLWRNVRGKYPTHKL